MLSQALGSRELRQAGQTIFVVMLVLACIFLCIAIAFPTYEFIRGEYWRKPMGAAAPAPSPPDTSPEALPEAPPETSPEASPEVAPEAWPEAPSDTPGDTGAGE